jgi:hypothetical protein
LKALLADMRQKGAKVSDREAALVLRTIEKGAREVRHVADGGDTAYLTLMARLLPQAPNPAEESRPADSPRLIV